MMVSGATIVLIVYFIQGTLGHAVPWSPIVGVVGGHTVDIEDVPFMAYIYYFGGFGCGGSIIHEQFVLTAAHCVLLNHSFFDHVRVGSSRADRGGKIYRIAKYISHEQYKATNKPNGYDLGLLKLFRPLTFGSSVAPLVLADSNLEIYPGMKADVSGWGDLGKNVNTNELHQVSVSVASPSNCMAQDEMWMSNKVICVSSAGGGSCFGDSGGPLVAGGRQIGLVSSGYEPCGNTIGYYVNVAAHTKWIHEQLILYS